MIKKTVPVILVILTLVVSSCGFHTRAASNIPMLYRKMYLETDFPYDSLTTQLKDQLTAVKIALVDDKNTPVTLRLGAPKFTHDMPSVSSSSYAVTYTYTLSISVTLITKDGTVLAGPKTFNASDGLMLNANQIYTTSAAPLLKRELERNIIDLIYHWLTIQKYTPRDKKHHANSHKTTRH